MNTKDLQRFIARGPGGAASYGVRRPRYAAERREEAFEQFAASELYCAKCRRAMPVRQKLLLTLPSGDLYDYLCTGCGESLGTRTGNS